MTVVWSLTKMPTLGLGLAFPSVIVPLLMMVE